MGIGLIAGILFTAIFTAILWQVEIDSYAGYAFQTEGDQSVYRLEDLNGQLQTFAFTQGAPGMPVYGWAPKEGEWTHNVRIEFSSRFIDLEDGSLEITLPTGQYAR